MRKQQPLLQMSITHRFRFAVSVCVILFYVCACNAISTQNSEEGNKSLSVTPTQDGGDNGGITIEQDSLIPPIPPGQVRAILFESFVELRWQGTGSDIDDQYIVYRRLSNSDYWEEISIVPVKDSNRGEYVFHDDTIESGISYEYAIAALNHYGKESSLSEIAKVEINE